MRPTLRLASLLAVVVFGLMIAGCGSTNTSTTHANGGSQMQSPDNSSAQQSGYQNNNHIGNGAYGEMPP